MTFDLVIALALVVANGFFVASEFSIARLRPTQIAEWERMRRPGARSVRHAVDHIDAYLAACQLGITLASIGLGVVGEPVFEHLLEPVVGEQSQLAGIALAAALAFFLITMLHVVVGELAPKSMAISRTGPTALVCAPLLRGFYYATKPLVDVFNAMGNLLLKPFGIPPARDAGPLPHSEDELLALVRQSSLGGVLEQDEGRLAERALAFDERRVREIMRPRRQVATLTTRQGPQDAMSLARETGHTRFPLVEPGGGLDAALGVVNVKELLLRDPPATDLRELATPLPHVPDAIVLSELLRLLRQRRSHLAAVVDEHGTAVGIVTLEDLLEELVGDIRDEFDGPAAPPPADGDGRVLEGAMPLHELEHTHQVSIAGTHEATIGGHIVERIGRVPEAGEIVELDGLRVEIVAVGDGGVESVRLDRAREDDIR